MKHMTLLFFYSRVYSSTANEERQHILFLSWL